jgi:hypothetical protein
VDLEIIAGETFELELPKNKKYLYKYFHTRIQKVFVRYFILFGNTRRFVDHTGFFVIPRYLRKMKNKFLKLEKAYEKARSENDIEAIALLESGKFKV